MASLLIFFFALASSQSVAAAAESVHNVTTVGWVTDGDNKRSTISLLYSCLFTTFLCTWSAMHPSVPGEKDGLLRVFGRKCGYLILGVVAPEVVGITAVQEWHAARMLVRNSPHLPTSTHGFLVLMGGFSILVKERDGEDMSTRRIRVKPGDFVEIAKRRELEFPTQAELMDRSKGDWISKSITSIQIIWFVCQLIGRAVQNLPMTTLELFTCAIVACTLVTYAAWWSKPLDVQRPVLLDCEVPTAFLTERSIYPLETAYSLWDVNNLPSEHKLEATEAVLLVLLIVLVFTAPHLIGWNFYFPTPTEKWLWRVASILCAGLPIAVIFCGYRDQSTGVSMVEGLWDALMWLCIGAYILVRAYLFIEVFVGLRSVPADVYTAINWSAYIPHI